MHYEVSLVVKVPLEKAYFAYTDFEAAPKWSREQGAVRVSRREGDTVYIEGKDGNRRTVRQIKLFPQQRVESEGETRFSRKKSTVTFEEVPEGTRVTASLELEIKGRWAWVLRTRGKAEVESSALEELTSFARYVEGLH
jgi:uncharacterized membrane protein